jgi:SAM-dependent methyltransferase
MNQSQPTSQDRFKLRQVAFFGRTLAEYLQMFSLDPAELRGQRILDVASGPGSFVAEALALGLDVIGCDPMYNGDPEAIAAQGKADIDACREQIRRNPTVLVYSDIDAFYGDKYVALERFAADFRNRRTEGRYVAGALPSLPFADRAFDLVLTANFLMVYAPLEDGGMHAGDEFGLAFHLRSVEELARVTGYELRIPGMHTWTQPPEVHPYCGPITDRLQELGFKVTLVQSPYDDGCSAATPACNRVLVARR